MMRLSRFWRPWPQAAITNPLPRRIPVDPRDRRLWAEQVVDEAEQVLNDAWETIRDEEGP